mmetsp:Transcript_108192/g.316408  ORF Transcript_108192/g.316408 Transcript_108192/m.316408 type:complete len:256 (+) Transcript_108192:197-964(+)
MGCGAVAGRHQRAGQGRHQAVAGRHAGGRQRARHAHRALQDALRGLSREPRPRERPHPRRGLVREGRPGAALQGAGHAHRPGHRPREHAEVLRRLHRGGGRHRVPEDPHPRPVRPGEVHGRGGLRHHRRLRGEEARRVRGDPLHARHQPDRFPRGRLPHDASGRAQVPQGGGGVREGQGHQDGQAVPDGGLAGPGRGQVLSSSPGSCRPTGPALGPEAKVLATRPVASAPLKSLENANSWDLPVACWVTVSGRFS